MPASRTRKNLKRRARTRRGRQSGGAIQLVIQLGIGQAKALRVSVEPTNSIADVIQKVKDAKGTPDANLSLIWMGTRLPNEATIEERGLQNGDVLYAVYSAKHNASCPHCKAAAAAAAPSGMKITVQLGVGPANALVLDVAPTSTVETVIQKLRIAKNKPEADFLVRYMGNKLERSSTLADNGIVAGSKLTATYVAR